MPSHGIIALKMDIKGECKNSQYNKAMRKATNKKPC